MKFKSIFILFNITLLLFMAVIVLPPFFIQGLSFQSPFWRLSLPLLLVLLLLSAGFNIFYFTNRKLFLLLEKEDWPALARYLEDRVVQQGRYSPRLVRLLANCYLVLADSASVMSLENKVSIAKPSIVDANALVFGTARILGKDISGAARFFETRKGAAKGRSREWMDWYHAFALLLDRQYGEAAGGFSLLARLSAGPVTAALASYFLQEAVARALPARSAELRETAAAGKERVLAALPGRKNWEKERARLSTEIHAAAIARYMEETGNWLYNT